MLRFTGTGRAGVARAAAARAAAVRAVAATAVARAVPVASLRPLSRHVPPRCGVWAATDGRGLVGLDGCEVRLCDPCARVRPCPVCVPAPGVRLPNLTLTQAPPGVFLPVPVRTVSRLSVHERGARLINPNLILTCRNLILTRARAYRPIHSATWQLPTAS